MMKKLVFLFQNVMQNAHFIIERLDIVLKNSLMTLDRKYFQQIFGIIMGTYLASILANLYVAMLQELTRKCVHDKKLNGQFFSKDSLTMDSESWKEQKKMLNIG